MRRHTSRYDFITNKQLIKSGTPDVYQLIPEIRDIGTVKRMTLGQRNPQKENRTILLVGETGAGKSTMVNALVNYLIGVSLEDKVWFEIVEKDESRAQIESQTADVTVYEIFGFEDQTLPFSLTIIDTPGFGDTNGTDQDEFITHRLLDLFRSEDGIGEINAVGLVLKSSDNRLSDRIMYIFNSVVSLFGKDIENTIVALITHSDGVSPENALAALQALNIKCAKDEDNEPVHFMFNNHQSKQETKKNKLALKSASILTNDQMKEFTSFLGNSSPKSLVTTVVVLNSRIRLTACIQNLQERVELIELQQKEIQQTQEALKKCEEEKKNNENFTVEIDEVYKEKEKIDGGKWWLVFYKGATTCNTCKENCHHPRCTLAWYPSQCEVMKGGHCTSCTNKCPPSSHVKEDKIYVTKKRKVKKTLDEVKRKYDQSKAGCETTASLLKGLEKTMQELQKNKDQWMEEAFMQVLQLEEIALNVDSLSTHIHLDFLIKQMKGKKDLEKVKKLEEMQSRVGQKMEQARWYKKFPIKLFK